MFYDMLCDIKCYIMICYKSILFFKDNLLFQYL